MKDLTYFTLVTNTVYAHFETSFTFPLWFIITESTRFTLLLRIIKIIICKYWKHTFSKHYSLLKRCIFVCLYFKIRHPNTHKQINCICGMFIVYLFIDPSYNDDNFLDTQYASIIMFQYCASHSQTRWDCRNDQRTCAFIVGISGQLICTLKR